MTTQPSDTTSPTVAKLPQEAIDAWVDWDPGYEPKESLTVSQFGFVRAAFMAGWLARQPQSPSTSENALGSVLDLVDGLYRGYGVELNDVDVAIAQKARGTYLAMKSKEQSND